MFPGPLLPLPPEFPLIHLVQVVRDSPQVGAWILGSGSRHRLTISAAGRCVAVMLGDDLGELLGWCAQVVVRAGAGIVVLPGEVVVRWRALQVVTGTPLSPGADRLEEVFPGAELEADGFRVPMMGTSPEAVLAECVRQGIPVVKSRVVYRH